MYTVQFYKYSIHCTVYRYTLHTMLVHYLYCTVNRYIPGTLCNCTVYRYIPGTLCTLYSLQIHSW